MYNELHIRTQYDGKDYRSVMEIYQFDKNGNEEKLKELTELCIDIATCADQGVDTWTWIQQQVSDRLSRADIKYSKLLFDEDEPCI